MEQYTGVFSRIGETNGVPAPVIETDFGAATGNPTLRALATLPLENFSKTSSLDSSNVRRFLLTYCQAI
jgi:hypothetical protein